jgi:hypothetical protein
MSERNVYVYRTNHDELRGHALVDFARSFGKFEGSGNRDMAELVVEKITAVYAGQISMPVSDAWSKLPKVSTLVEAVKEGFSLAEAPIHSPSVSHFEKSLRQVFECSVPALRELSVNAKVRSDTLQSVTGNMMALRDEAVENLKVSGDGVLGILTRRINARKADELHNKFLTTTSDVALSGAASLTAIELCQMAGSEANRLTSELDEIEVLKEFGQRKAPTNAYATLSRLNDVNRFLEEHNTSSYKAA